MGVIGMSSERRHSAEEFGSFKVVDLSGTWREMGRQYGELLSDRLREAYDHAIEKCLIGGGLITKEQAEEAAAEHTANLPHRLRELLVGMSEISGLDYAQHVLLNAVETLASDVARHTQDSPAMHGTGIAVWGAYAQSNLIYGRSWDWSPRFKELAELLVTAVFHPSDGSLATALIGFPGAITLSSGMNSQGIFVELNDGEPSGGALKYHNRVPAGAELFMFLLDSFDIDQLESFFYTTRSNRAYLVGAADDKTARCYEWPVFDVKRRLSVRRPGLMVATNHFTEPSWGLPRPDDELFCRTRTRRQNLLNLAEHFKGSIDVSRMQRILDTRLEDLGSATDNTVFQVIAVPGQMTISLKVPGRTDWVDIPLEDHLKQRVE